MILHRHPIRVTAWDDARGRWARGAGLGDVCSDGPGAAWTWQRMSYVWNCAGPPPPPPPPAPTIALASSPGPGSVYAGADASGAAVYATPSTAAENQQAVVDRLNTYYGSLDVPSPADCSGTFSFLNPVCAGNGGPLGTSSVWPWLVGGGLIAGMLLMGGRR